MITLHTDLPWEDVPQPPEGLIGHDSLLHVVGNGTVSLLARITLLVKLIWYFPIFPDSTFEITSTSKVLRSCSSQIFVNIAKKNIFELLTFLLETNL